MIYILTPLKMYNLDIVEEFDKAILRMPIDKWFIISEKDRETKIAIIKDWIDKDILTPYQLTLNESKTSFKKSKQ